MHFEPPTDSQQREIALKSDGLYRGLWISENGVWTIALKKVMFGFRAIAYRKGSCGSAVDYCAGNQPIFAIEIATALKAILSAFPESLAEELVCEMMPRWKVRPINMDPCWSKLQELASSCAQEVSSRG